MIALAGLVALSLGALASVQAWERSKSAAMSDAAAITREKAVWEAFKNKQDAEFRKYFGNGYTGVYEDGMKSLDDELSAMKQADLREYSLAQTTVNAMDEDATVVTYKVTVHGTYGGQDVSGDYYASSVWLNRGGRWSTMLHTEVKAKQ